MCIYLDIMQNENKTFDDNLKQPLQEMSEWFELYKKTELFRKDHILRFNVSHFYNMR